MQGLDATIRLLLSALALVLFLLVTTRYKQNRWMKLALFASLVASSAYRAVKDFTQGIDPSWLDILAIVFFSAAAIMEAIPLMRGRSGRA